MQRNHSAIGIDISDNAVKCVQLESYQGGLRVLDVCSADIARGGAERANRQQASLEALRRAIQDGDFRGKECLSSLRLFETTTRHIRIPAEDVNRAREVLGTELKESDQDPGGEFNFQFEPIAELVDHGVRKCEYLCCVADPLIVRDHLEVLTGAGLQPVAIDLDTCAQVRPFARAAETNDDSLVLSIDMGARCAHLVISRGGDPVLMRTVPVSGAEILKTLEQKLNLDSEMVRDLAEAKQQGVTEEISGLTSAISRTLSSYYDTIINRVLVCARYTASLYGGHSLDQLRVLGGAASLPGCVEYLSENLGLSVADADPFRALGIDMPRTAGNGSPANYATAVGLAVRGLKT